MHGLAVYVKEGLTFTRDSAKLENILHLYAWLLMLFLLTLVLSINTSTNVFVFGY